MKQIFTVTENGMTISGSAEPDLMKVFVSASCDQPRHVEYGELVRMLSAHVPADLLHTDVLNDIALQLSKGEPVRDRRVAKGVPPTPGTDGKLVFLARKIATKSGKIKVKEHGTTLDVENIEEKRQLARVYKPKPGVAGKTATGKVIPAPIGKSVEIKLGGGIAVDRGDEQYDLLVATKSGFLSDEMGTISILDVLSFDGDYDHRFGSVNFIGRVNITGDVKTDSFISADGGVEIAGGVYSNVIVRSSKGNIDIRGSVNGGTTTKFQTGGDFDCTVIEQVDIEAKGTVRIKKLSHSSDIRTQGYLLALGAHIYGGEVYSSEGVVVGKIGNAAGVQTTVHLCATIETQKEYQEILARIQSHDKALHLLELHLGPMLKNPERIVHLNATHKQKVQELLKKHSDVSKSRQSLIEKKETMLSTATKKDEIALSVESVLYSNTKVTDDVISWTSLDERKGPCGIILRKGAEEFVVGDFIPAPDDKKEKKHDTKSKRT